MINIAVPVQEVLESLTSMLMCLPKGKGDNKLEVAVMRFQLYMLTLYMHCFIRPKQAPKGQQVEKVHLFMLHQ